MDSKHTYKHGQKTSASKEKLKSPKKEVTHSETDSSISLTFDSATDLSYKSEDVIGSPLTYSSERNVSGLSTSDSGSLSKSDQNIRFDSGLGTDCYSPSQSAENFTFPSEDSDKPIIAQEASSKKIKFLWQDIYSQDKDGDTILHLTIVEARSDIIYPLIHLAPHPDFLDICNDLCQTPLHLATLTGKPNIVRRLIVAGAMLDIQDHCGNIPLHIAARNGDLDCVQAILQPISATELDEARTRYQVYVDTHCLSHLINLKNFEGHTCVHLASLGGFRKVLACLYNHGADINDQEGKSGRTALHYAIENANSDLVQLLLVTCRANPFVPNYAGKTSYQTAWSLRKRHPIRTRLSILDALKRNADKWETPSDSENNGSSSDETESSTNIVQENCCN